MWMPNLCLGLRGSSLTGRVSVGCEGQSVSMLICTIMNIYSRLVKVTIEEKRIMTEKGMPYHTLQEQSLSHQAQSSSCDPSI